MTPDKFEVIRPIGQGHFGRVLLVRDRPLNAIRALKVFHKTSVANPSNFFTEAQALAEADHPNIVRVYEAGHFGQDDLYISMEYLPNGSLLASMGNLPMQPKRAVAITCDALRGLHYLHGRGLIHRDIKPANILIGDNGTGKLSDLGLAERIGADGFASMAGYLPCMAPEALADGVCNKQTDVYAAGVTLYAALNGGLPPAPSDLQARIEAGKYPPRAEYRPQVPRSLRTIVNRAMQEPTRRFPDAEAFRHALESCAIGVDWTETTIMNGQLWRGFLRNGEAEMTLVRQAGSRWALETRRRRPGGTWRRILDGCGIFRSLADANAAAHRILGHLD